METESESENESDLDLDLPTRVTEKLKDWNPNERSEKKRGIYDRIKPVIYFPFQFWKATLLNIHNVSHQESFKMSFFIQASLFYFKNLSEAWFSFENTGGLIETLLLSGYKTSLFSKVSSWCLQNLTFFTHTLQMTFS